MADYLVTDGGGAVDDQTVVVDGGGAEDTQTLVIDGGPAGFPVGSMPRTVVQVVQGDPRLILGSDGSRLQFIGGQPLMDRGLENAALISLFTDKGWCGNRFINSNRQIGSGFLEACNQPITRQALIRIQHAAELALRHVGEVSVTVTNPTGYNLRVDILLGSGQAITLSRSSGNWIYQANEPAHRGILWH